MGKARGLLLAALWHKLPSLVTRPFFFLLYIGKSYLYFKANPFLLSEVFQRDLCRCFACKCFLNVPSSLPWLLTYLFLGSLNFLLPYPPRHLVLNEGTPWTWQDFHWNGPALSSTLSYQLSNSQFFVGKTPGTRSLRARACLVCCGHFWRDFSSKF